MFRGLQGVGFYKGGYDDVVGNMLVCIEQYKCCVVILGNDVWVEVVFLVLVVFVLGDIGVLWQWEYGVVKVFVE